MKQHLAYIETGMSRPIHVLVHNVIMKDEDTIESLHIKKVDPFRERDFIEDFGFKQSFYPNIPINLQEQILNRFSNK